MQPVNTAARAPQALGNTAAQPPPGGYPHIHGTQASTPGRAGGAGARAAAQEPGARPRPHRSSPVVTAKSPARRPPGHQRLSRAATRREAVDLRQRRSGERRQAGGGIDRAARHHDRPQPRPWATRRPRAPAGARRHIHGTQASTPGGAGGAGARAAAQEPGAAPGPPDSRGCEGPYCRARQYCGSKRCARLVHVRVWQVCGIQRPK